MPSTSPLVFRPSPTQRTLSLLLAAGSWFVGIQGLVRLLQNAPRLIDALRVAQAQGESTFGIWVALGVGLVAVLAGGILLFLALVGFLLIEGTQVLVDDWGLSVEIHTLPGPLARRLGAGHLVWKQVRKVEKGRFFFRIQGGPHPDTDAPQPAPLRFLLVDELERLLLIVLERSPHLEL